MHLKTVTNVLYFMRHSTGSQCRSRSTGVMWSRRNVHVTKRAAFIFSAHAGAEQPAWEGRQPVLSYSSPGVMLLKPGLRS